MIYSLNQILVKMFLIIILFTISSCNDCEVKRKYIIPENYIGDLIVIYDYPNSKESKIDSLGFVVQEFNSKGVFKTYSSPVKEGCKVIDQFYYKSKDKLKRIYSSYDSILINHEFKIDEPIIINKMKGQQYFDTLNKRMTVYKFSIVRL